jgi:hypothetical protein
LKAGADANGRLLAGDDVGAKMSCGVLDADLASLNRHS